MTVGGHGRGPAVRRIVLLRHAKADRPIGVADVDRPLTARGHVDAAAAGAWLLRTGLRPEAVFCSPARRTRQTWHGVALGIAEAERETALGTGQPTGAAPGGGLAVRYEPVMYGGGSADLLDLIRRCDPVVSTVLLVGHNPTISDVSYLLDPTHSDPAGLRTSGIVVHRTVTEWHVVNPGGAPIEDSHTARG